MLQFISQTNDRYSIAETVQMAIEGGCRWIQLHLPNLSDDDIKAMSGDIIEMCREAAAFLMLEDRPELAKELGLHGVHLKSLESRSAASLREELGPEAVIGVETDNAATILSLRNADIDYVTLPETLSLEQVAELIATVRNSGIELPIVATGNVSPENVAEYKAAGVSGLAVGEPIIEAKDPVATTELYLSLLTNG